MERARRAHFDSVGIDGLPYRDYPDAQPDVTTLNSTTIAPLDDSTYVTLPYGVVYSKEHSR